MIWRGGGSRSSSPLLCLLAQAGDVLDAVVVEVQDNGIWVDAGPAQSRCFLPRRLTSRAKVATPLSQLFVAGEAIKVRDDNQSPGTRRGVLYNHGIPPPCRAHGAGARDGPVAPGAAVRVAAQL